ncbi:DUF929 family protein [Rudaeicoccus suwonensis]|uniref:Uncharacterized protein DUF929 n=1 Tax=Rudaeicoccus suwonensis TaxID=657409 RepID=A0A561E9I3_9MICO|nr:DUF929 family protein [Rudaeicoccus suwonensis]TWE12273.1 uncharacterized protein DUF929 [Rudaeicoccus suwonensis]
MSTTQRTGRDKLAQLKAEQARAKRQKTLLAITSAAVVVVLAVVAILWVVADKDHQNQQNAQAAAAKNSSFVGPLTSIPASTFNTVGLGSASNFPSALKGATALTVDGKPRIIYYGGQFCPYCAMERWSIVAALSRFGSFKGLSGMVSSEDSIPTLDFLKSSYTSQYISFTPYEVLDQNHNTLQTPPAADNALFTKYDAVEYVPSIGQNGPGTIPFLIFGGTYASAGSTYNDASQMSGMTQAQVIAALKNPNSPITQGIVGAANVLTAQICQLTKDQPSNVCGTAGVMAAGSKL